MKKNDEVATVKTHVIQIQMVCLQWQHPSLYIVAIIVRQDHVLMEMICHRFKNGGIYQVLHCKNSSTAELQQTDHMSNQHVELCDFTRFDLVPRGYPRVLQSPLCYTRFLRFCSQGLRFPTSPLSSYLIEQQGSLSIEIEKM